jgi:hypothetical protein
MAPRFQAPQSHMRNAVTAETVQAPALCSIKRRHGLALLPPSLWCQVGGARGYQPCHVVNSMPHAIYICSLRNLLRQQAAQLWHQQVQPTTGRTRSSMPAMSAATVHSSAEAAAHTTSTSQIPCTAARVEAAACVLCFPASVGSQQQHCRSKGSRKQQT